MQAIVVPCLSALLAACGPGISGTRPCEEGFVEHARIETTQDIADLPRVKRVRRLEIIGSELETLEGLECVEWVETLRIEDNPQLTRLTGLEGLRAVKAEPCDETWATAGCMSYHVSMWPFQFLPGVGDATIGGNHELESLAGLDSLEFVNATLEIRDNESLVSLDGLQSLTYVALPGEMVWNSVRSALRIERNPQLESLDALVSYVGGARLEIRDNPVLEQLFAPRSSYPDHSGGVGALVLEDLPRLVTLDGLTDWSTDEFVLRGVPLVEEIPRMYADPEPVPGALDQRYMYNLIIDSNAGLRSIEGLRPVATIEGHLVIRGNGALQNLAGLERLQYVVGEPFGLEHDDVQYAVLIEGNTKLQDLDALDPASSGSFVGHVNGSTSAVRFNPELPTCVIERFVGDAVSSWIIEGNGEQPCP